MRPDERFVGASLTRFFGTGEGVVLEESRDDPPDLYLRFRSATIGVEVTRLLPFSISKDGAIANSTTQNSYGVDLLNHCDMVIGPTLREPFGLLVSLEVPVPRPSRYKRALKAWLEEVVAAPVMGARQKRSIDGIRTTVTVIPRRTTGKVIAGVVSNRHAPADIGFMARTILERQIRIKSQRCAQLKAPIWLGLLNNYWMADAETYKAAAAHIRRDHCFERVFLISEQGSVTELLI